MKKNNKLLFLIILLVASTSTFAASCKMQSGGTLDNMLNEFYTPTSGWRTVLYPAALKLYWFWVVTEMGYQIAVKKVLSGDYQKLWYFVLVRMFTATAFAQIFVNPDFYSAVIEYFVKLGGQAGGFNINASSGNPFGDFSPSAVLGIGECMWTSVQTAISNMSLGITDIKATMTVAFPIILAAAAVYVLVSIIAVVLFMTALEAYIVMNAGIILLGFAGSSWTMGFWNKYLSYVGGIAIRLFVMCLILGLLKIQIDKALVIINMALDDTTGSMLYPAIVGLLVKIIIFTFLVLKIPAMAGSMLTGTVNSGLGDVVAGASMMLAGAGVAAGLSKMGINMSSGGGGSNAEKDSLKNSLRGDGGGGMPKSSSGGSSSGGQMTPSQQAKQAGSESKRNEAIGEKVRGGGSTTNDSNPAGSGSSSDKSGSGDNGFANHMSDKMNSGSAPPNSSGSAGVDNGSSSSSGKSADTNNGGGSSNGSTSSGTSSPDSGSAHSSGSNVTPAGSSSSESTSSPSGENASVGGSSVDTGSSSSTPNSGSIGGNSPASGTPKSSNASEEKKSKAIKDSLNRNKDKFGKNFNKVNQDQHAGGAEVNVSGLHKE